MAETEVPKADQPMIEMSGAEDLRLSARSKTKAIPSSAVPASLRRLVFRRDQRRQWLDHFTGRKCGSPLLLELDPIRPRWVGGLDEPLNLRLLCRSHNNLKYSLEARIRARSARTESLGRLG